MALVSTQSGNSPSQRSLGKIELNPQSAPTPDSDELAIETARFPERPRFASSIRDILAELALMCADSSLGLERGPFTNHQVRPGFEFTSVSLRQCCFQSSPHAYHLLEHYYPKFSGVFYKPDERSSLEECFRDLASGSHFDIRVAVLNNEVIGGSHWWLLEGGGFKFGFEEQIWIDKGHRGLKLGRVLNLSIVEEMKALGVHGILADVKDPHLMSQAELAAAPHPLDMDAVSRVQFWKKMQHQAIDAPYIQPSLREGAAPITNLMLTVKPFEEQLDGIPRDTYLKLLASYFTKILGVEDISSNPSFLKLQAMTEAQESIPFISIDQQRSYIKL